MQHHTSFTHEPSRQAALDALARVDPAVYSKSRNFLNGAVTGLSPWITHGFLSLREAARLLMEKHRLAFEDKLIFEFAWREFFKHVHGELGNQIFSDIRQPVWPGRYKQALPDDIRAGRTGIQAIDEGVRLLYETGYLHNHVRMWIASYVVHLRKVHWKVGADWMYSHLLDGDLASNHLSWQWVAGTFSHKPYVFNAGNVQKYAPRWDCSDTAIDTTYEDLENIARSKHEVRQEPDVPEPGICEPTVFALEHLLPVSDLNHKTIDLRSQAGVEATAKIIGNFRKARLVHPWDLRSCFELKQEGELRVGVFDAAFHAEHRWNKARWAFVQEAMEQGCDQMWIVDTGDVALCATMLRLFTQTNAAFEMRETLNPGYSLMQRCLPLSWLADERLLPNPVRFQQSFSRFYREATGMAGSLQEAVHGDILIE
ncbi:MAG: deoxyribodipyrimidine photolyase [Gammaproteobacteria bacterium]|nr:deoxyribodipyrimidine photolyase [Gammaproteobacteria bacterium]MBU0848660.1 deoxyribodipyrimidine photolyase [Gammaproteobacteria bacterium]MBU1266622.1 deoxyribodipyrimidine photolyase [Gammaproteobacteria bacterium]MBU1529198.1 deoxyribodipyrimidine photolyase [Gammaproteobacteria bacterium]MBU1781042.1 deoxyribodipyrimidine photolyase [Gammaproteobacteria bacterium]